MAPQAKTTNLGQIVEYIPNRLYLAAYTQAPTADTLFPYADAPATTRTPSKRPAPPRKQPFYFSVDDSLLYNAFHHDFGPLHIGHLYRFALYFHDVLAAQENKDRPIVFWSAADPRSRANSAALMACYMVLIQHWPPHLALAPIAQVDPPLMPFRDAGYSQADYGITVQDVVYGVWKAKEEGVVDLENFDLDEYERFERVEHGDFNWVTPNFLAFASPQHKPVERVPESSPAFAALPRTLQEVDEHKTLPKPFKNVLNHFSEKDVGLVVRLNSHLYSPSYFEALGIQHLDMIFEDGTCPPMKTVRKFIRLAHDTIVNKKKNIAVHCKAGLGRTGCLIGAYLIYRHGFTANEVIAFMRFMRPGMVVGPQQHWLHIRQGTFREWWVEEKTEARLRREMAASAAASAPSTPVRAMQKASLRNGQTSTPPNRAASNRTPLSEVDDRNNVHPDDYLPAPTPGQPRKAARAADRHHPYGRTGATNNATTTVEEEGSSVEQQTEIVSVHRSSHGAESDEEIHLRVRAHRRPSQSQPTQENGSQSPTASRSFSHQTTTTTVYSYTDADPAQDIENMGPGSRKAASSRVVSTPVGTLPKTRGGRQSPQRVKDVSASGVRKTSGRVGSVGHIPATAARKVSGA
ncbi:related to CDC14 - dual specificity phosphatase [Cephalotrichum gorgonifer]|uniref:protein-tyrosine-phosphatase n=1 Tax=Cephalotrichum gorgonifer TaxID=2041049 RepID=A0AAE8MUL6_9PEZI|nr:related to CDC14 - dual specificity phosphatase [Cephalotrichum gorgonifer]